MVDLRGVPHLVTTVWAGDSLVNRRTYTLARGPVFGAHFTITYTDEFVGYNDLNEWYGRYVVNHIRGEYVNEQITTNSIESVWTIFKRRSQGHLPPVFEKTRPPLYERNSLSSHRRQYTRTCHGQYQEAGSEVV